MRDLTEEHMRLMAIPRRYWNCNIAGISSEKGQDIAERYTKNIDEMINRGIGLLLWGSNGKGKTGMAVAILKYIRAQNRIHSAMFLSSAEIAQIKINNTRFNEETTMWERAKEVDALLIDDLGKGIMDSTGFAVRLVDELIRNRNAETKITIITTNFQISDLFTKPEENKEGLLMASTGHTVKECMLPVFIEGPDRREQIGKEIADLLEN